MNEFFSYGEKVPGFDVRVLNEREARAAAAILFVGAFLGLTNGVMLGTALFSKYFVSFFAIDFTLRVLQPRYSPSLLMGRFFVRNQTPEYVGATQKRFAWMLGFILAWPMFYYLVIHFEPNPIKVFVCLICMLLLFLEAAFSICLGCKLFNLFKKEKATHCPGDVCEITTKDPVQKFSLSQRVIVITAFVSLTYGIYAYMTKLPDRTYFMKAMKAMMLSDKALEQRDYENSMAEFDDDE